MASRENQMFVVACEFGLETPEQLRAALTKAKPTVDIPNPDVPRNEYEALTSFTQLMWRKLKANTHKGGWTEMTVEQLMRRIEDEVRELKASLMDLDVVPTEEGRQEAAKECADISNFCMMLADVLGQLSYRRRNG